MFCEISFVPLVSKDKIQFDQVNLQVSHFIVTILIVFYMNEILYCVLGTDAENLPL